MRKKYVIAYNVPINEIIKKINTSLLPVFTPTNLHKMPMTYILFSELT